MRAAPSKPNSEGSIRKTLAENSATVLLETLVALALLVGAAVVIGAALNSSIQSVERLRLNTHASSLAVTILSELQLGTKIIGSGPQVFDPPFDAWTWEALSAPDDNVFAQTSPFSQVEVVIRHEDPPATFRLSQRIHLPGSIAAETSTQVSP